MAKVVISGLVKTYPDKNGAEVRAVAGIDLTVEEREFMVLVGPSGCGKSTTLRMIAGLEEISAGTISIDGRVVNRVLPKDRDIAMVFQNYALYPHMTVRENLGFSLKMRGSSKSEIETRVREAAALLGLESYLDRKPKALSGGQRQRVAVGRAIVRQPKVFLFDEPLSNLDAKMRAGMRMELSKLHARLGATMIYVTHDQIEAMTMGSRICVMKDGVIMQVAKPLEVYHRPNNLFVAGFIGSPPMNFFRGTVRRVGERAVFGEDGDALTALRLNLPPSLALAAEQALDKPVILGVRPEDISDAPGGDGVEVRAELFEPMGAEAYLHATTAQTPFVARVNPSGRIIPGQRVRVAFNLERAHLFDAATEQVLGRDLH